MRKRTGGETVSHQDDILAVLQGMGEGWHETGAIHEATGNYWQEQRITVYDGKARAYTFHALSRLLKRGIIEKRKIDVKTAEWRVIE